MSEKYVKYADVEKMLEEIREAYGSLMSEDWKWFELPTYETMTREKLDELRLKYKKCGIFANQAIDDIASKFLLPRVNRDNLRLILIAPIAELVTEWESRDFGADRSDLIITLAKAIAEKFEKGELWEE